MMHGYEVRPRKDHRGVDLISDVLPFGRLWYGEPNAISWTWRLATLRVWILPRLPDTTTLVAAELANLQCFPANCPLWRQK
jgi:hypothetical protein